MQKKNVVKNVFNTLSLVLIACAIFLPWTQIRKLSLNSVYFLCAEHIATHSMSYSYMIGDYLQRFEITTSYTSSFTYDTGLVRCDPEHMFYFKTFCDHLNHDAILRPYRYYMAHNTSGACQIEYYPREQQSNLNETISKNPSKKKNKNFYNSQNNQMQNSSPSDFSLSNYYFLLYYIFPYNLTHDMIRVYNETTDFRDWNYRTEGKFVEFPRINESSLIFRPEIVLKEPYWTTGLAAFGSQNESRVFTIVYPIIGEYNATMMNRTIRTDKFHVNIKNQTKDFDNFYSQNNVNFNFNPNENNQMKSFLRNNKRDQFHLPSKDKNINKNRTVENDTNSTKVVLTAVASSFFTESLYVILKARTQAKHSHFIVTDYTYNVLIDNEIGAIFPKLFNDKDQSVFPNISDMNSTLWKSVEKEIIEVPIDVPLLVNVSSTVQYMIMKRIIDTRSRYSFYLIMLLELNPTITEIFSSITIVFICCLILIILVVFGMRFFLFYVDKRSSKKLKMKQEQMVASNFSISSTKPESNFVKILDSNENNIKKNKIQSINMSSFDTSNYTDDTITNEFQFKELVKSMEVENHYFGTLMDTIEKLRSIQLRNVDDIILNNMIDSAVEELTRNDDELFNIEFFNEENDQHKSKYKNNKLKSSNLPFFCPFCSYLINANNDFTIMKENDISLKQLNEKEKLKRNKILNYILKPDNSDKSDNNDNNYYESKENRNDDLYYIWNIKINSILDSDLNDDLYNSNPHKYLVRKFMKLVQKGHFLFTEFYPDSLALFILSFTKDNISCYYHKIQSFQFLKKIVKHNFKFWLKSKVDIFILFLASILRHSKIKNTDQILNLFHSFVGYHNVYFFHLLKALIDETMSNNTMKIYGDLSNRTLSPSFSISNNAKDTVLFMKSLLVFSDFCHYLTNSKRNKNCFTEINRMIFSKDEILNEKFLIEFHLEMAKNVVAPWLNLMNTLAPMNEFQIALFTNIDFWIKKLESNEEQT